jgi:NAD(P)-dependent dehydrogenase (short-subunit alcohol dehydrogenase family)
MSQHLTGKRAIITGGGGNLGRASALAFAREGASVAVVDIVATAAEETVRQVTGQGGTAVAIAADVSDEAQVERAVAEAAGALGGLDTLFNNAGIMPHQDESVLDADLELWRFIASTNVHSAALCTKYAVPHITAAGGGISANYL